MTLLSVTFQKTWTGRLDPRGAASKVYSAGWSGPVHVHHAVAAIGDGAATPRDPLTPELADEVDVYKRALDLIGDGVDHFEAIEMAEQEVAEANSKSEQPPPAQKSARRARPSRKSSG